MAESIPLATTEPGPDLMPTSNAGPTSRLAPQSADSATASTLPLRDVIAETPSFWPPAPGWWLLAGIGLALLWWLAKRLRRLSQNEHRALKKAANQALQQLAVASELDDQQLLAQVSALLKRVATQRFPKQRFPTQRFQGEEGQSVAQLSGKAWLAFLDSNLPTKPFAALGNADLFDGHYQATTDIDRVGLLQAAKQWVKAL